MKAFKMIRPSLEKEPRGRSKKKSRSRWLKLDNAKIARGGSLRPRRAALPSRPGAVNTQENSGPFFTPDKIIYSPDCSCLVRKYICYP